MLKKIILISILSLFFMQSAFAKQEKILYVVKNVVPESIMQELNKNVPNATLDKTSNIVYTNTDIIYYFKAYQNDKNTEIFAYTNNGDLDLIMKKLSKKAYQLTDKATLNKYNNDFISFVKTNNIKSVKYKEQKKNNSQYVSYNPYLGNLRNQVLETSTTIQNNITIERKKLKAKGKVKHYTYEYVYDITNNTGSDIVIKKVASAEFIGLTQIAAYTSIPRGMDFVPIYGIVYGVQTDLEKNKFTRPHPTNETIKNGATMRVLALSKLQDNPIADFVFIINNKEVTITVK